MVALTIEDEFIRQTILDISDTERAFDECRSKVHGGPRKLLETGILICQILKDSFKRELKIITAKGIVVDRIVRNI